MPATFRHHLLEASLIITRFAVVVSKALFVQVAEQVEGFNADIRTVNAALEQAPEVLQPVRMNPLVDVFDGMIDNLMS